MQGGYTRNRVLAGLPEDEFSLIRPFFSRMRLAPQQILNEVGEPTEHAFFVEEGVVALVVETVGSRQPVQVGMVGFEGFVGCEALLKPDMPAPVCYVSQIPGRVLRVSVSHLQRIADQCPTLKQSCMDSVAELLRQSMHTAASNARNSLTQRCVRWLLMAHERIEGDSVAITHEALSASLGVRRSGVTVVVAALQNAGLVRLNRGRITIVDRAGLEPLAGDFSWRITSSAIPEERKLEWFHHD